MVGYQYPLHRVILFYTLCVLTGGALFILSRWFLRLRVALTLVPCPLGQADYVVVTVRGAQPVMHWSCVYRAHVLISTQQCNSATCPAAWSVHYM